MRYKIVSERSKTIAKEAIWADTFYLRLKGLMFTSKMDGFDALIIDKCKSIHTFFMRYPIDVIFLDRNHKVVKIKKKIKPWRMTPVYLIASYVVELKGGSINNCLEKGEKLDFICIS